MILRNAMTCLLGIGSLLLVADSCAASPFPGARPLRDRAGGYELTVLVDGVPARTYMHDGETYVLGQLGSHYTLRVSNHTGRRIEAVVSVDGRDAIDGKPADWRSKRGYLVPAWGSVDIEGWRISHAQAAAFRFSSVPDSYAARTGSARDVGVIGVAVFPERYLPPRVYRVPPPTGPTRIRTRARTTRTYRRGGDADSGAAPRARTKRRRPAPRRAPSTPPPRRRRATPPARPVRARYGKGSRGRKPSRSRTATARAWAPSTARRSARPSTRSSSCAPTPAPRARCWASATTTATACSRWGSPSTALRPDLLRRRVRRRRPAPHGRPVPGRPTGASPRPRPDGSALADWR